MRFVIIIAVLALLNAYVALRLVQRWPWAGQHIAAMVTVAIVFFLLQLAAPVGDHELFPKWRMTMGDQPAFHAVDWVSYLALGMLSCLFLYTVCADIVWIVWLLVERPEDATDFNRRALITLGAATLGTVAVGLTQAVAGPAVRRVDIPLQNLPAAFDGFTIAQISDLHVGPTIGRAYAQNVVDMTNALNPDIIALTGDFADGSVADLRDEIAPLADLHAPQGKFFITGNHEYYWGADAWEREQARLGARVLSNEHVVLTRGGDEIILAGVTDYSTLRMGRPDIACDPKKSLLGAPPDRVKILLAHQPASYKMAHEAGFDLQLSGHTHAGQYFPFNLLVALFQRYYKGLNRHKNMWVYVNRGTGYWGPPMRTGIQAEITLITLRQENVVGHAAS